MRDTTALFSDLLNCPYKAFLKLKGENGEAGGFQELQSVIKAEYHHRATEALSGRHPALDVLRQPMSIDVGVQSHRLLLNVQVDDANDSSRFWTFDAIESRNSTDGSASKVIRPLRVAGVGKPSKIDRLLAMSDGLRLAELLGHAVDHVSLVHGSCYSTTKLKVTAKTGLTNLAKEAQRSLATLKSMMCENPIEPKLVLNSHCDMCEFKRRCHAEAERRDDLSLLRGLQRTEIDTLHGRGIFTVTQLAYTCRPKAIERSKTASKKHSMPLQAMAIRDKTVYVRKRPELPQRPVKIYLDIEGVPEREFYYLIGMLVERSDGVVPYQFWADSEGDEQAIWSSLRRELADAGDYTLFHFGRYENAFLEQMKRKYGQMDKPNEIDASARLCDIHAMIRTNIYFPAYSNGLKAIASFLGATWQGPVASGLDSLVWRHRWELDRQTERKEALMQYNMDDCFALKTVALFLENLENPAAGNSVSTKATSRLPNQSTHMFGSPRFAIPEIARFTKCAYFNYQRDKILVRTDKRLRKSIRRKKLAQQSTHKVNERIECPAPGSCTRCGAIRISARGSQFYTKVIHELKFTERCVKRWNIEYSTRRYDCRKCRFTCYSQEYPTGGSTLGHGVACWAMLQQIALKQTGFAILESFHELFNWKMSHHEIGRFRRTLAAAHEATETGILERLRSGTMICVDEAKISFNEGSGYVWVFSNAEEVIYRFSTSREGNILNDVLKGFGGVLVSDYYGAYDSTDFKQQKCLIHLIRDINDDLLKAPFNAELKEMAERFTDLLKLIIDAVDRYGLKKRHLAKFLPKATQFLDWVNNGERQTKVAQGYQKRFQKYGTRLFTFLSHDGVPWNNNLAENAVKVIASRRAVLGASFSEEGIQDYLRLLSIYQTLRRKGGSFLRFLLSKQTDLFRFVGE